MFYRETDFRETSIGKVPRDWETVRLGDKSELIVPMRDKPKVFDGDIPWIRIEDLDGKYVWGSKSGQKVSKETIEKMNLKPYPIGTVLCSCSGEMGVCAITKTVLTSNQTFIGIVPNGELDSEYLYYLLTQMKLKLQVLGTGTTIPYLSREKFEKLQIPKPSLSEQRAIVGVLDVVDSAIELADKVIAKNERLKKGLMQELSTKGIGHKEYKQTPIGKIPKEWNAVQLEDLISDIKNGFASGKRDEKGIVQVRMNNITTDGRLVLDSYLKVPTPENIDVWLLKPNDFLFNNTNSIDLVGKSAIFKGASFPCTFSNHFTRIRFKESLVLPEWILNHFIIQWQKGYFKSVAIRHVGQAAVHTEYLLRLKISLPPLDEQKKIVGILSTTNRKLELERNEKTKLEKIQRVLMDLLLTGKVRAKGD